MSDAVKNAVTEAVETATVGMIEPYLGNRGRVERHDAPLAGWRLLAHNLRDRG